MHAIAVVLLGAGREPTEDTLDSFLQRYSQEREVPEYEKPCWCIEFEGMDWRNDRLEENDEIGKHRNELDKWRGEAREIERRALDIARKILPDIEEWWPTVVGSTVESIISHIQHETRLERRVRVPFPASRYSVGALALERERRLHPRPPAPLVEIPSELEDLVYVDKASADRYWALLDGWEARTEEVHKQAPNYGKPNPVCETCHGSGIERTTWNPEGYWDWFSIGGRWTNFFGGEDYDPTLDPRNWRECLICGGTGMREDVLGRRERTRDPRYTCNGCGHDPGPPGTTLKHPSEFAQVGNIVPTSSWIDLLEIDNFTVPMAVVTPDGEWHMNPKQFRRSKEDEASWAKTVRKLARENRHSTAVAVDYHH